MRVSQDSLASLGLFAAVVDGCWCSQRCIQLISPVNQLSSYQLSAAGKPKGFLDAIQRCVGHGFGLLAALLEDEIQLLGVVD